LFNESDLINEFQSINWQTVFASNSDPSLMFDNFYAKTTEIIDQHIPIKQLSRNEIKLKSKPCMDNTCNSKINSC
jgi:transcription antitermination factor NusA-like protein